MNNITINNTEFNELINYISFFLKKSHSFDFNPYMISLASKLRKQYTNETLRISNKDLQKVLFVLNIPNLIDKRKKYRKNILFSYVMINGFRYWTSTNRNNCPRIQLNKNQKNKLIKILESQTEIKFNHKLFPKYILNYSLK